MTTQYRTTAEFMEAIERIKQLEALDAPTTLEERVAELLIVCRDAAVQEAMSPGEAPERLPWPESTRAFLRENAKAIYGK